MLTKIYIDGFRHFKNFTLKPHFPHTLLCGLNGTGKTSVWEIVSKVQKFVAGNLPFSLFYSERDIPRWEKKEQGSFVTTFALDFIIEEKSFNYLISINYDFKDHLAKIQKETLSVDNDTIFNNSNGNVTVKDDTGKKNTIVISHDISGINFLSPTNKNLKLFLSYLFTSIFPQSINPAVYFTFNGIREQILTGNAHNFPAWYKQELNKNTASIANSFKKIKPFIKNFKQFLLVPKGDSEELLVDIQNNDSSYQLNFNELSDGQKILCIFTIIFSVCPKNSVIFMDEFENFLSPVELQPLYNLIQDVYEEKNVQTILVSHHQKTLNWFQDSAFVFSYSSDGTFIHLKDFSEEKNISIDDYLFDNQGD